MTIDFPWRDFFGLYMADGMELRSFSWLRQLFCLFLPPLVDCVLPRSVILGKTWAVALLMAALANLLVSAIVSVCARSWRLAGIKFALIFPLYLVGAISTFFLVCFPVRMGALPEGAWIDEDLVGGLPFERERLQFRGGIDAREPVIVFEVTGGLSDAEGQLQSDGPSVPSHVLRCRYERLFAGFREPIELVEPLRTRLVPLEDIRWSAEVLETNGRQFVICHHM